MSQTPQFRELDTADAVREAGVALVGSAKRTVHIYSRDMDPALYDEGDFLAVMRSFLTSHPRAFARMLVHDASQAVSNGHRLINLAQRLSSRFEIREPGPQHRDYNAAFLVTDGRGVIYRELGDRFGALVSEDARPRANQLIRYHTEAWEFGHVNPNIRALGI